MKKEELEEVNGGGFCKLAILGGIIVFLVGLVDGFVNPSKCNN